MDKLTLDFQVQLVSCMASSRAFMADIADIVKVDYFDDTLRKIVVIISQLFSLGQDVDKFILNEEIRRVYNDKDVVLLTAVLSQLDYTGKYEEYVRKRFMDFAVPREMELALEDSRELLNEGKYGAIPQRVTEAYARTQPRIFSNYFDTIRSRAVDRNAKDSFVHTRTLIPGLDAVIRGLKIGQLGVWLAPPSRGKSTLLRHCARASALQGQNVPHYTLELHSKIVEGYYDAAISDIPENELNDYPVAVVDRVESFRSICPGNIFVIDSPARTLDVSVIRAHYYRLMAMGYKPDVIVIDYADLMASTRAYSSKYEECELLYEELRSLASEFKIAIWTASQSNRGSMSKRVLTMGDIADSFGKCKVADVIIGICQTAEEQQTNTGRFVTIKNRNGQEFASVPFRCDFSRSMIYGFEAQN